jgi:CRP-like cAMP-binding protein
MYVVTKGHIDIYLGSPETSEPVARLGPGDAFGEIPLLKGEPRGATAVIAPGGGAELLEVDKPAFRTVVRANPEVVDKLAQMVAEREKRNAAYEHPSLAQASPARPKTPSEVQQSIIAAQVRKVLDPMDP